MIARIARIIGIVFLCSICVFPLIRLVAPLLSDSSLTFFLFMSLLHSIFMIGVAWFINKSTGKSQSFDKNNESIGLFLFLSGVFFVIAFGMGKPPRDANEWIANRTLEVWRAIFLELAVVCTGLGLYFFSRLISNNFSKTFGRAFLILTLIGVGLTIYDFYWGLFLIPNDIDTWAKEGKDLNQFFSQYDMKNELRGSARCLIYLVSILTFFRRCKNFLTDDSLCFLKNLISNPLTIHTMVC